MIPISAPPIIESLTGITAGEHWHHRKSGEVRYRFGGAAMHVATGVAVPSPVFRRAAVQFRAYVSMAVFRPYSARAATEQTERTRRSRDERQNGDEESRMGIFHTPVGVRASLPCNTIRLPTHWPTLRKRSPVSTIAISLGCGESRRGAEARQSIWCRSEKH